ncbi:MAG: hypothetical protein WC959_03705 [Kiritimatiellales bacterium]
MKPLWQNDTHVIGIFDERNYFVADKKSEKIDKRTGKASYKKIWYYSSLVSACESVAKLQANKESDSLHSWLSSYRRSLESFRSAFMTEKVSPSSQNHNSNS